MDTVGMVWNRVNIFCVNDMPLKKGAGELLYRFFNRYYYTFFNLKNKKTMETKEIIIELIKQDMYFNQYLESLRKLGIEIFDYQLELMEVIVKLMQKPEEEITDEWIDMYVTEINKCKDVPIAPRGENLYPLAEKSYRELMKYKPG